MWRDAAGWEGGGVATSLLITHRTPKRATSDTMATELFSVQAGDQLSR